MKMTINNKIYTVYLTDIQLDVYFKCKPPFQINSGLLSSFKLIDDQGKIPGLVSETDYLLIEVPLPLRDVYENINNSLQKEFLANGLACKAVYDGFINDTMRISFHGNLAKEVDKKIAPKISKAADAYRGKMLDVPDIGLTTLTEQDARNLYQILKKSDLIEPGWYEKDFVNQIVLFNHATVNKYLEDKLFIRKKTETIPTKLTEVSKMIKSPIHSSWERNEVKSECKQPEENMSSRIVKWWRRN